MTGSADPRMEQTKLSAQCVRALRRDHPRAGSGKERTFVITVVRLIYVYNVSSVIVVVIGRSCNNVQTAGELERAGKIERMSVQKSPRRPLSA